MMKKILKALSIVIPIEIFFCILAGVGAWNSHGDFWVSEGELSFIGAVLFFHRVFFIILVLLTAMIPVGLGLGIVYGEIWKEDNDG